MNRVQQADGLVTRNDSVYSLVSRALLQRHVKFNRFCKRIS